MLLLFFFSPRIYTQKNSPVAALQQVDAGQAGRNVVHVHVHARHGVAEAGEGGTAPCARRGRWWGERRRRGRGRQCPPAWGRTDRGRVKLLHPFSGGWPVDEGGVGRAPWVECCLAKVRSCVSEAEGPQVRPRPEFLCDEEERGRDRALSLLHLRPATLSSLRTPASAPHAGLTSAPRRALATTSVARCGRGKRAAGTTTASSSGAAANHLDRGHRPPTRRARPGRLLPVRLRGVRVGRLLSAAVRVAGQAGRARRWWGGQGEGRGDHARRGGRGCVCRARGPPPRTKTGTVSVGNKKRLSRDCNHAHTLPHARTIKISA
jgi:hypothetical protein